MQDKPTQAEPHIRRALAIRKAALGAGHPDVAESVSNLGLVYLRQKRTLDAQALLRRALEIRERALEPGHPDIAESLNNLGALDIMLGRFAEAAPRL